MKILNLIIKQKYFDAIMAGRKVQEFREVRPTTIKKLLQLDEEGYEVEDEYGNAQPIKYDAIRFLSATTKTATVLWSRLRVLIVRFLSTMTTSL